MYSKFFHRPKTQRCKNAHVERELFNTSLEAMHMSLLDVLVEWDENIPIKVKISYSVAANPRKYRSGLYELFSQRVMLDFKGNQHTWSKVSNFYNKNTEWIG